MHTKDLNEDQCDEDDESQAQVFWRSKGQLQQREVIQIAAQTPFDAYLKPGSIQERGGPSPPRLHCHCTLGKRAPAAQIEPAQRHIEQQQPLLCGRGSGVAGREEVGWKGGVGRA